MPNQIRAAVCLKEPFQYKIEDATSNITIIGHSKGGRRVRIALFITRKIIISCGRKGVWLKILFKFLTLITLFIVISILGPGCLERPKLPEWETEINIPLLNDTYTISDLIKVTNKFRISQDSIVQFYSEFNIDTATPQPILNLFSQNYNLDLKVSEFEISNLDINRINLSLIDITELPLPDTAVRIPIPGFSQTLNYLINLPDIQRIELASGIWKVRIHNYTNLNFDSLVLNGPTIDNMRTGWIGAQTTKEMEQSIQSNLVENPVFVEIRLISPGSAPDSIWVSGLDSLVIELALDSARILSGILCLPEITAENRTLIDVNCSQNFKIDSLELAGGDALLNFYNSLPTNLWINLQITKLNYRNTFRIESNGTISVPISLAGLKLTSQDSSNLKEIKGIQVDMICTAESTTNFVVIDQADGLTVNYLISNLNFRQLAGEFLQPIHLTSPEKNLFSIPGQGTHGLRVSSAEVFLHIFNTVGFPAELKFRIFARRDNGDSIYHIENIRVEPGSPELPSEVNLTIPVARIINFGARQIKFATEVTIFGKGRVDANSFACGNGYLSSPLRIAFNSDTTFLGEYRFSLKEKDRQDILDWQTGVHGWQVVSAEFYSDFSNHFPVGFNARLVVTPDTSSSELNLAADDSLVVPLIIPSGYVTGPWQNQYCARAKDSTMIITLDENDITLFTLPSLRSHLVFYFLPSDTVTIRPDDFLKLFSRAVIKLQVK